MDDARAGVDRDEIGRTTRQAMCCRAAAVASELALLLRHCVLVVDSRTAADSAGRSSSSPGSVASTVELFADLRGDRSRPAPRRESAFAVSPSTVTTEYSRSGLTAANWLLGSVQGVVVQTSRSASRRSFLWRRSTTAETARTRSDRPLRDSLGRLRRELRAVPPCAHHQTILCPW